MRRKVLFLAIVAVLILSFSAIAKEERPTVEIPKASIAVKIDGVLDEYKKPLIRMDNQSFEKLLYNPWNGKEDLSADLFFLWDDENLYVAGHITDDVPFANSKEAGDIWDGDCIEITLGMDENADPERPYFGKADYQIGLSPGNNKDVKPSDWIWRRDDYTGGIEVTSKPIDGGYAIEAKIPFTVLGGYKPSVGKKIGLDIAVDDGDKDKREIQFVWSGTKNFYVEPGDWGTAVLAGPQTACRCAVIAIIAAAAATLILLFSFLRRKKR